MKQVLQDLSSGRTYVETAPRPQARSGHVLIQSEFSLISTGTERMLVDFGRSSLIQKALGQPERLKKVFDKIKADGLLTTLDAVNAKLHQPLPLGYSNAGVIRELGHGVSGYRVGQRVVSNSPHADWAVAGVNLCAAVPDEVPSEYAAFTVPAAIGLQGIRLVNPTIGESVAVFGAGLIGLLTIQMLIANGCRVIAFDFDGRKLELAKQFGAEVFQLSEDADPVAAGMAFTSEKGLDACLICASTDSDAPVSQAARMSRKRGRIVLVGVSGLSLNREEFYEKELTFQVSCSYGPGRYDPAYERDGFDYPAGFVRWTQGRNFECVLDLMRQGRMDVAPLISKKVPFAVAETAYDMLMSDKSSLGILLQYDLELTKSGNFRSLELEAITNESKVSASPKAPVIGVIGAGNYSSRVMLPAVKQSGFQLHTLAAPGGLQASVEGRKLGFQTATSDSSEIMHSSKVNTVFIATRHDSHAKLVMEALKSGKHTFVEKPLAITRSELLEIEQLLQSGSNVSKLMVGFNRRFSPFSEKMKQLLAETKGPKSFNFVMNAGAIPKSSWVQSATQGGGRIIGEACHLIDLMRYLADSKITKVSASCAKDNQRSNEIIEDIAIITLEFEDGSLGSIHYFANGSSRFPKERMEVFASGRILQLDNFRKLRGYGFKSFSKMSAFRQDKGHARAIHCFLNSIANATNSPIPLDELLEVAHATITAAESLRSHRT